MVVSNNNIDSLIVAKSYLKEILEVENADGVFNFVYSMTTENIAGYLPYVNNFSKVLCVASSGDHLLNCVACGAQEVTIFDINPITYYLTCLKIGALNLNRDTFIAFFTVDNTWSEYSHNFFNITIYNRFKVYLTADVREFWDTFYSEIAMRGVTPQKSMLFRHMRHSRNTIVNANMYLNTDIYDSMRERIEHVQVRYVCTDMKNLSNTLEKSDKYNTILFSNISDYIEGVFDVQGNDALYVYNEFTDKIVSDKLAFGGQLFYAYVYQVTTGPGWTPIDNIEALKDYLKPFIIKVLPAYCRRYAKDNSIVDAVLIKENWFVNGKNVCMNK